jgi:hypothetical protein
VKLSSIPVQDQKLVKDDPGVIKIRMGRKRAHTVYSVPEVITPALIQEKAAVNGGSGVLYSE